MDTILESGPFSLSLDLKQHSLSEMGGRVDPFDTIPSVIRFSQQIRTIANLAKALYNLLQTTYPAIYTPKFTTAFPMNKNLKDMLVAIKL